MYWHKPKPSLPNRITNACPHSSGSLKGALFLGEKKKKKNLEKLRPLPKDDIGVLILFIFGWLFFLFFFFNIYPGIVSSMCHLGIPSFQQTWFKPIDGWLPIREIIVNNLGELEPISWKILQGELSLSWRRRNSACGPAALAPGESSSDLSWVSRVWIQAFPRQLPESHMPVTSNKSLNIYLLLVPLFWLTHD